MEDKVPTTHVVKSWSWLFDAIARGEKTHDLRINDRDYAVGDFLELHRYNPAMGRFTGEVCTVTVTYITNNKQPCAFSSAVLPRDYCILSIKLVQPPHVSPSPPVFECPECGADLAAGPHRKFCSQGQDANEQK